jgi:hypothetical protein
MSKFDEPERNAAPSPDETLFTEEALREASDHEVFAAYAALMRELRQRGRVRSEKSPIADYAEHLVAERLGGELEQTGANPGYDVKLPTGERVQGKCRRKTAKSEPSHYGDFSSLHGRPFDSFVGVIFGEDFRVIEARMTSLERVRQLSRPVQKLRLTIRALRDDPESQALDLRSLQI